MKLKVTAEHIKKGVPADTCNCPIALAIKDLCGPDTWVNVGSATLEVRGKAFIDLPPEAMKFIHDFDFFEGIDEEERAASSDLPEPFEFEVPDELCHV